MNAKDALRRAADALSRMNVGDIATISSTDLAIAEASRNRTLRYEEKPDRWGGTYCAIIDNHGIIEVHNSKTEAVARVNAVLRKVGG